MRSSPCFSSAIRQAEAEPFKSCDGVEKAVTAPLFTVVIDLAVMEGAAAPRGKPLAFLRGGMYLPAP